MFEERRPVSDALAEMQGMWLKDAKGLPGFWAEEGFRVPGSRFWLALAVLIPGPQP